MAAAAILNFHHSALFDTTGVFDIEFATSPPNLVKIGRIVKKWQQFLKKIQDGGSRRLEK